MDQYDNPNAFYSLVLRNGKVVGGARDDADDLGLGQAHLHAEGRPRRQAGGHSAGVAADNDVVSDRVWECTRLVISDDLCSQSERSDCLSMIVDGLVRTANMHGGSELMSLSPLGLQRALRQLGYHAWRVGEPYQNFGDGHSYAVLAMPAEPVMGLMAAE